MTAMIDRGYQPRHCEDADEWVRDTERNGFVGHVGQLWQRVAEGKRRD